VMSFIPYRVRCNVCDYECGIVAGMRCLRPIPLGARASQENFRDSDGVWICNGTLVRIEEEVPFICGPPPNLKHCSTCQCEPTREVMDGSEESPI